MASSVVDYREQLNMKMMTEIIACGYAVASSTGKVSSPEWIARWTPDTVGIAELEPSAPPRKYLFGLIKRPARRRILATIWIDNEYRRATNKKWVVEIQGRDLLQVVDPLVTKLASQFGAKVTIRIGSDEPEFESRMSDYGM